MKKKFWAATAMAAALALSACGGNTQSTEASVSNESQKEEEAESTSSAEESSEDESETQETEEETQPGPAVISVGDTISLDFVEITFSEAGFAQDIKQSVTTGNFTRTTGPSPEEGKQFLYLRGTIKNLYTSKLPLYDFFAGNFKIDDYNYEVTGNDCNVINSNGESLYDIDPLTSGTFTIYAAVPNELVENHSKVDFTFGFYDLFDNKEFYFSDNPISDCPYQYTISIE